MKPLFYKLCLITGIALSIMYVSCGRQTQASETGLSKLTVPTLLPRNPKIQHGKEWDEVQSQYQKQKLALEKNAEDYEAAIRLAHIFIREARVTGEHGHYYPAALVMTDYILQREPEKKDMEFLALVTKAGVQLSHHEFAAALESGKSAIALNQRNPQVYGVMVDAHVELGMYDEAIQFADVMIALKPDLRSYARISYIREIHGQIPEAIEAMKMAVKAGIPGQEDTAWAMNTLAELYALYGDNEKALATYNEILALRPDYPFAIAGLADVALKDKNYPTAEAKIKEAIDIIPEVGFYITLAEIYKKTDREKEFQTTIKNIKDMLAEDEKSGHNMNLEFANVYLDLLDDPDMALLYAGKEYEKRPANIDVNRMMAKIYLAKKDVSTAEKYARAAGKTQSKHPELKGLLAAL